MFDLLNVRILSFVSSIISLVLCICMLYISRTRKTYKGFFQWTIASILYIFGLALLSMREILPEFVSVILANTLILTGSAFIAYGLELFTNNKRRIRLSISLVVSTLILFLCFTYLSPNINARIAIISLAIAVYYAYSAYLVYRYVPRLINSHNRFLVFVFGIQAAWLVLRMIATVFIETPIVDFMKAPPFQGVTVVVFFSGNILLAIGLIALNFQRVEYDWSVAISEVKTLRGLIPICASCKKIRDDKGMWNQIESYIRDHSDAEFSHGLCPDCMQKLYPDFSRDAMK